MNLYNIWVVGSLGFLVGIALPLWLSPRAEQDISAVILSKPKLPKIWFTDIDSFNAKEYLTSEWRLCLIFGLTLPEDGGTAEKIRSLATDNPEKFLQLLAGMNSISPWEDEFKVVVQNLNLPSLEGVAVLNRIKNSGIRDAIIMAAVELAADVTDYSKAATILTLNDDSKNRELTIKLCDLLIKGNAEAVVAALLVKPEYNPHLMVFLHELSKHNIEEAGRLVARLPSDWQVGLPARLDYLETALSSYPGLVTLDQAAESLETSSGPRLFWLSSAVRAAMGNDLLGTVNWIAERPNGVERNELLKSVAGAVASKAPEQFESVVVAATSRNIQNDILREGAASFIEKNGVAGGYDWAASFSDPALQKIAITQFVQSGWERDRNEMIAVTAELAAKAPERNLWPAMLEALGLPSGTAIDPSNPPQQLKGLSEDNLVMLSFASRQNYKTNSK